jgi:hypothetical protein
MRLPWLPVKFIEPSESANYTKKLINKIIEHNTKVPDIIESTKKHLSSRASH